jgi:hypothetical protein
MCCDFYAYSNSLTTLTLTRTGMQSIDALYVVPRPSPTHLNKGTSVQLIYFELGATDSLAHRKQSLHKAAAARSSGGYLQLPPHATDATGLGAREFPMASHEKMLCKARVLLLTWASQNIQNRGLQEILSVVRYCVSL